MTGSARRGERLSRARVERIVAATNTAPSADNCQPWRFSWDGEALAIALDPRRAKSALDHLERVSRITLGGVIEALTIAAAAEGLAPRVTLDLDLNLDLDLDPTPGLPGTTWATARFEPAAGPHELEGTLDLRCTDRRLYRGGSLEAPVFDAIRSDAARDPGCGVRFLDRCPPDLLDYLLDGDGYVWRHDVPYREIMAWFRFSQREIDATRDGAPWRSLGFDVPELPGLGLARSRWVQRLLDQGGFSRLWRHRLSAQLASSAGLFCVTAPSTSPRDLVRAGRLALRAWLRLNRAGHGVQPFVVQSLFAHAFAEGRPAPGTLPDFIDLFRRGPSLLARAFGLDAGEQALWLFRTGLSPALPAKLRTRRLPVEKLLTWTAPPAG
jgi:hypothetical protein